MSAVIVDDHLLRDILTHETSAAVEEQIRGAALYTTNLWYLRLCRSVAKTVGGRLTGALPATQRLALGRELVSLPADITIVPLARVAWQMAERHGSYALSTLSCEALVVAEHLDAKICVWAGDDGPNLRAACHDLSVSYVAIGNER